MLTDSNFASSSSQMFLNKVRGPEPRNHTRVQTERNQWRLVVLPVGKGSTTFRSICFRVWLNCSISPSVRGFYEVVFRLLILSSLYTWHKVSSLVGQCFPWNPYSWEELYKAESHWFFLDGFQWENLRIFGCIISNYKHTAIPCLTLLHGSNNVHSKALKWDANNEQWWEWSFGRNFEGYHLALRAALTEVGYIFARPEKMLFKASCGFVFSQSVQ